MNIFLKKSRSGIEEVLPKEFLDIAINEVPCLTEGCDGKIYYYFKQMNDGSAVTCSKCKKSIIVKVIEV